MLSEEQIFKIKWLIALNEFNIERRGSAAYHKPKSESIYDIHARAQGLHLGLRAYNHPKVIKWLQQLDIDLFEVSQRQPYLDPKLLPDVGINFNEYELEPMNSTIATVLEFMNIHSDRRPVVFENEYWYHKEVVPNKITSFNELKKDDLLVVSVPFFENFDSPDDLNDMLIHCCENNIPVLLDLIWLPLVKHKVDFSNFDCVEVICHSLTKTIPLAGNKVGFRFWRKPLIEPKKLYPIGSNLSVHISQLYLKEFGYYYVRDSLLDLQNKWCEILGIENNNFVYVGSIPKDHVLESQHLHSRMIPSTNKKLFSLVPFYENDAEISHYLEGKKDVL